MLQNYSLEKAFLRALIKTLCLKMQLVSVWQDETLLTRWKALIGAFSKYIINNVHYIDVKIGKLK